MATEPTSDVDTPAPSNRRSLLIGAVVGLLAFVAGIAATYFGLGDVMGGGSEAPAELQDTDLVAHTEEEWFGKGLPTVTPIGTMHINLDYNESEGEPKSYLTISLSLKVNLDQAHAKQFPQDAGRLAELNERLKNIRPLLNQHLLEFFGSKNRQALEDASISQLRAEIGKKISDLLDDNIYTELEKDGGVKGEAGKVPLIADVLFEEFRIQ